MRATRADNSFSFSESFASQRVARGPTLSSQNPIHQDRDVSEAIWNPTFVSFAFFV